MKNNLFIKLLGSIIICILVLLPFHIHGHKTWNDDGHCFLCQILYTGYTYPLLYNLLLFLTIHAVIHQTRQSALIINFSFRSSFRAPPINPF
ncbi:MAG: hypothetical protein K6U80_12540 [Firmicutes bacterium]|nr:hypothetical protein [Bacillota bacterium]